MYPISKYAHKWTESKIEQCHCQLMSTSIFKTKHCFVVIGNNNGFWEISAQLQDMDRFDLLNQFVIKCKKSMFYPRLRFGSHSEWVTGNRISDPSTSYEIDVIYESSKWFMYRCLNFSQIDIICCCFEVEVHDTLKNIKGQWQQTIYTTTQLCSRFHCSIIINCFLLLSALRFAHCSI